MFNKIIIIIIVSLLLLFSSHVSASAQTNTYGCQFNPPPDGCQVAGTDCNPGCFASPAACAVYNSNATLCNSVTLTCQCSSGGSGGIQWGQLYGSLGQSGGAFLFSSGLTIGSILTGLLLYIFPLAGLLLLLYLLYGGFQYLTSGGDPKAIQQAKGILTTALLGFAIIFTAYWVTQILGTVLGLGDLETVF